MAHKELLELLELLPPGHLREELIAGRFEKLTTLTAKAVMNTWKLRRYLGSANDEMTAKDLFLPTEPVSVETEGETIERHMAGPDKQPDSLHCWMLEEWRRISIPDWRHILNESIECRNKEREEYARWMLREILRDEEYQEREP
jgi:hypothetical protein